MVANMPHIMHDCIDGMVVVHMVGILHININPFNLVIDFTKDLKFQVGIIDWGLLLRVPNK